MCFFSQPRQLLWVVVFTILVTTILANTVDDENNVFDQGGELMAMELHPFQLYLKCDGRNTITSGDEMMVLSTTREYLSLLLQEREPSFSRLSLYQFTRYPETGNFAKVAMSGELYFFKRSIQIQNVHKDIMMSFVEPNMVNFVEALQNAGMAHIVNASLMSIEGDKMGYSDGEVVKMNDSEENDELSIEDNDREMSDDMRRITIFLSLLIPGSVLFLACAVASCRFLREVNWKASKTTPDASMWQNRQQLRVPETPSEKLRVEKEQLYENDEP